MKESGPPEYQSYDVVFEGTPIRVRKLTGSSGSDAIAENEAPLIGIVVLRIDRIVKGSISKLKIMPPSRGQEIKEAMQNKEFRKIFFSDYKKGESIEIDRTQFSIAVKSPLESFGVTDWEKPDPLKYRVYLKRYKDEKDTYVMVKREPVQEGVSA